mmetsp:Transcript_39986/g.83200  ORF Transcript_39986/g.83200 Transcript_39986/m.83200 type:complete len:249 (-) Transcript_39986:152-898(-)
MGEVLSLSCLRSLPLPLPSPSLCLFNLRIAYCKSEVVRDANKRSLVYMPTKPYIEEIPTINSVHGIRQTHLCYFDPGNIIRNHVQIPFGIHAHETATAALNVSDNILGNLNLILIRCGHYINGEEGTHNLHIFSISLGHVGSSSSSNYHTVLKNKEGAENHFGVSCELRLLAGKRKQQNRSEHPWQHFQHASIVRDLLFRSNGKGFPCTCSFSTFVNFFGCLTAASGASSEWTHFIFGSTASSAHEPI